MSGLPTPPLEEHNKPSVRRSTKVTKPTSRISKRTSCSHEYGVSIADARNKRVWKACERCRMKKTKCDGESPCKRCKDDGLVCTAGSRKKTEFKQLPRGYAEVLENTQYALIATVQKLYTMLRNGDTWELGEPELNDRGQPVIHDIASKLGCIRPCPDLPYSFPEGEEDIAELEAQIQAAAQAEQNRSRCTHSPPLDADSPKKHKVRAGSSGSEASFLSSEVNDNAWSQPDLELRRPLFPTRSPTSKHARSKSMILPPALAAQSTASSKSSMLSPIFTGSNSHESSTAPSTATTPYSPWSTSAGGDEFLTSSHALQSMGQYLRAPQIQAYRNSCTDIPNKSSVANGPNKIKVPQMNDMILELDFLDGTIRPDILDEGSRLTPGLDPMDSVLFDEGFECEMTMA